MSYEALIDEKTRSIRLLEISPDLILDLFKVDKDRQVTIDGRRLECVRDAIPATATVASCGMSERGNVLVQVQDASFTPTPFGGVVPRINPEFMLRTGGEWRDLKLGEIIREADEFEAWGRSGWKPAPKASIGKAIETWHARYRRREDEAVVLPEPPLELDGHYDRHVWRRAMSEVRKILISHGVPCK